MALDKIKLALEIAKQAGVPVELTAKEAFELLESIKLLQSALEYVESVKVINYGYFCPWCGWPPSHHDPDCLRQRALGLVEAPNDSP